MVEVIRLAILLAVLSTEIPPMFNFKKVVANATASVLLVGATYLPAAQAQDKYTSFGGMYRAPIPAKTDNFIGTSRDVLPRCQVFSGCTAARLIKGKVRPASNKVVEQLSDYGFRHKVNKKRDRSFFTLPKKKK